MMCNGLIPGLQKMDLFRVDVDDAELATIPQSSPREIDSSTKTGQTGLTGLFKKDNYKPWMFVFMGRSGSGKNFIAKRFCNLLSFMYDEMMLVWCDPLKYYTTRPPREHDMEEELYYDFIDNMSEAEWATRTDIFMKRSYNVKVEKDGDIVDGVWRYGCSRSYLDSLLEDIEKNPYKRMVIATQIESIYGLALLMREYPQFRYHVFYVEREPDVAVLTQRTNSIAEEEEQVRRLNADAGKYKWLSTILEEFYNYRRFKEYTNSTEIPYDGMPFHPYIRADIMNKNVFDFEEYKKERNSFPYDKPIEYPEFKELLNNHDLSFSRIRNFSNDLTYIGDLTFATHTLLERNELPLEKFKEENNE